MRTDQLRDDFKMLQKDSNLLSQGADTTLQLQMAKRRRATAEMKMALSRQRLASTSTDLVNV